MKNSTASTSVGFGNEDYLFSGGSRAAGATASLNPTSEDSAIARWKACHPRSQTQQWSDCVVEDANRFNTTVFPGVLVTRGVLDNANVYRRLMSLIDRFRSSGWLFAGSSSMRISEDSADAARAFLKIIERFAMPPQIGTDDDSVVFAWERHGATTLVIVDGWRLHLVERAGTAKSSYTEELPFDGSRLPDSISSAVPAR